MDRLRYDLRHALRAMSHQPVTSAIIMLTLALAIGANTAVFSAVHTVLIRMVRAGREIAPWDVVVDR